MKVVNTAGQILVLTGGGGAGGGTTFTAGISTLGNTAGNTGMVTNQLLLAGGNNITLSGSTNAGGNITVTISGPNTAAQTNQSAIRALGVSNTGNTAGNTGVSTGIDWVVAGSNNITASQSTVGGGPNTIWLSGPTLTQFFSNTGTTFNGANISGSITDNTAGLQLSLSVAAQSNQSAIKGFGASNTGNTLGNTGISTGIDWVIAGTNNITVSESTVGGGPNTIWLSGPNAAAGNVNFSAGTTSGNLGSVVFSDSNGVSWGLNGSTITATVKTAYVGLNTAQTNVTWTVNSSGISLNAGGYAGTGFTSTTTAGTAIVATQNTAGLSMGVPAFITTASAMTRSAWFPPAPAGFSIANGAINGQASWVVWAQAIDGNLNVSAANVFLSLSVSTSNASSHAHTVSLGLGVYTRNASTLSLFTSGSTNFQYSELSGGSISVLSGAKLFSIPFNASFTPGDYWFAYAIRTTSANANWITYSQIANSGMNVGFNGPIGTATNATLQLVPGWGYYTSTSASPPGAMNFNSIIGGSAAASGFRMAIPLINFVNYTA